jgi:hypothetical protein
MDPTLFGKLFSPRVKISKQEVNLGEIKKREQIRSEFHFQLRLTYKI